MRFGEGQKGNPGGKPVGARNALGADFVQKLATDFRLNGVKAIRECRVNDPGRYLSIIAATMPRDLNVNFGDTFLKLLEAVERNGAAGLIIDGTVSEVANGLDERAEQPAAVRDGRAGSDP